MFIRITNYEDIKNSYTETQIYVKVERIPQYEMKYVIAKKCYQNGFYCL